MPRSPAPAPRLARLALRVFDDARGRLTVFEDGTSLPFTPRRVFTISRVPRGASRANHAVSCDLALVAVQGRCSLLARTAAGAVRRALVAGRGAILVRQGTWMRLSGFSRDAILLVFASKKFGQIRYVTKRPS